MIGDKNYRLLKEVKKAFDPNNIFNPGKIVNDDPDLARTCDADGVHLGQEDLPLPAARKIMPHRIIGISTHDLEQAREAEREGADYIGFGPLFGTHTKDTGYRARGVDMLQEIRAAVKLPIVAIGGINQSNVAQVWRAGADSAAPSVPKKLTSAPRPNTR
jgi:thiamine-phosphate pyrophosphorylase